jgi:hypothetical protein
MKNSHTVKVGRLFANAIYQDDALLINQATEREFSYNYTFDLDPAVYPVFEAALKAVKRAGMTTEDLVAFWSSIAKSMTVPTEELVPTQTN